MYEAEGAFLSPEYQVISSIFSGTGFKRISNIVFSFQAIAELLTSQFTVRTFPAPDCTHSDNFNYRLYVIMQVGWCQLSKICDFMFFCWMCRSMKIRSEILQQLQNISLYGFNDDLMMMIMIL